MFVTIICVFYYRIFSIAQYLTLDPKFVGTLIWINGIAYMETRHETLLKQQIY